MVKKILFKVGLLFIFYSGKAYMFDAFVVQLY